MTISIKEVDSLFVFKYNAMKGVYICLDYQVTKEKKSYDVVDVSLMVMVRYTE